MNSTQIIKCNSDSEISLTIGRTVNNKIYIDIRHYYQNKLIDMGEITLSQSEWGLINTNLNQTTPRLYQCPECGDIVTEEEIRQDCENGGYGCCMCMFGNGARIFVEYEPYSVMELDPPITSGEMELIRIIRRLHEE